MPFRHQQFKEKLQGKPVPVLLYYEKKKLSPVIIFRVQFFLFRRGKSCIRLLHMIFSVGEPPSLSAVNEIIFYIVVEKDSEMYFS